MKRTEIEQRFGKVNQDLKSRIETTPVYAVLVALAAGFLLGVFAKYLLPLMIIAGLILGAVWFVADKEEEAAEAGAAEKRAETKSSDKKDSKSEKKEGKSADSNRTNGDARKNSDPQPVAE